MITPQDIVIHLRTFLPAFTNLYNDEISATASITGGVATFTATNHGLIVGQKVITHGSQFENLLANVTLNPDGSTRFETTYDHDLTQLEGATVTLQGIGAPWDGVHDLEAVPNRRTFEIATPAGETVAPTLTASSMLVETRSAGLGGIQTIATVPDVNTFTINVPADIPSLPEGDIGDVKVMTGVRVYGAASIERAENLYTQYDDGLPRLFVIMTTLDVSKDRHSLNDAVAAFTSQNDQKLTVLQNFSTVHFKGTASDDVSGFKAQGEAYSTVSQALINTLYGFKYADPITSQNYVTVLAGHGPGIYNTAYYQHVYDWQLPAVLTFDHGFNKQPDVAFRDIAGTWTINRQDMEQLSINIDLDQEPL